MPLEYENKFRKALRKNVRETPKLAAKGDLDVKINNFCDHYGFEREAVLEEIQSNRIVAALFAKNPNKQNFYENLAAEYICRLPDVKNFKNLPNNELAVSNGAVLGQKELTNRGGASSAKTIDFEWQYRKARFYASHKYTKDSGGSQGGSYKDLQAFISEAARCTLQNTYFVAIADGPFYQGKDKQAGKKRIDRLKDLAATAVVHACTIDELEALMKSIVRPRPL